MYKRNARSMVGAGVASLIHSCFSIIALESEHALLYGYQSSD
jgi:hypothetical protein